MTVYNKAIAEFEALSSQEKKTELLSLLHKFEKLDVIFVKLIHAVDTKNYTDRIMN
jgi:Holliday junction resolvasome RuvABC ATP-dependent DNA helicase subunit